MCHATLPHLLLCIQHVGNTTGHSRGKVAAGLAQHYHAAPGHVFTSVIAEGLDHGVGSAVAHTKSLTRDAPNVGFAAGRTIERNIADDYVFLCAECSFAGWVDDDLPARQSLAEIVVRVAFEFERNSAWHKRAETLPGGTIERELNSVSGQPFRAVTASNRTAKHRADSAIDVTDRQCRRDRGAIF